MVSNLTFSSTLSSNPNKLDGLEILTSIISEAAKKRYKEGGLSQLNRTGKTSWNKGISKKKDTA